MDVNGTSFHLVVGQHGWLGPDVVVEPAEGVALHDADDTLRLVEVPFVFPERRGDPRLRPDHRRGAGRDAYGNTYWIGPDRRHIRMLAHGSTVAETFWPLPQPCEDDGPAGDFTARRRARSPVWRLSGLAVTEDHYLVVGAPDLPGVLVFDLHAGGPPVERPWSEPIHPVDISPAPGGGAWILDVPPGGAPARYWGLDRGLRIRNLQGLAPPVTPTPDFTPTAATADSDPDDGHAGPGPASGGPPSPGLVEATEPVSILGLPDGSVLVLDRGGGGPASLRRHHDRGAVDRPLSLPALGGWVVDAAWLPDPGGPGVAGEVVVADAQGDQATAFRLAPDGGSLERLLRYLPMRLFGGKALVEGQGEVFHDQNERWLPLVDWRRCRFATTATVELPAFDSGTEATTWHRLTLDARIPARCGVSVEVRSADTTDELADRPWRDQPPWYRRRAASEVPYHRYGAADATHEGTWELLLQGLVGRHLQVRLHLRGDGHRTPRLWALRAHEPRFSYLEEYLPDVYAEDRASADLLERWLANVEGVLTTVEGRVADAQRLLDTTTVEVEYLPWLAGWLGGVVDPGWDEPRVRLFLRHAVELFARRGTSRGLLEAVRLAIHPCPDARIFDPDHHDPFGVRIVEAFRTRRAPGVVFGDPGDLAGPRVVETGHRWEPTDGRAALDQRWRDFLLARHGDTTALARAWGRPVEHDPQDGLAEGFAPLTPTIEREAADRADLLASAVAVAYDEVGPSDADAWRTYLAQRHRRPAALSTAWRLTGTARVRDFAEVQLPTERLPADGRPLQDWIEFVSTVLPTSRAAHRFAVLVPVRVGDTDAQREDRLRQVSRVVEAERPAHTEVSVRSYWAAFRVGEARIGLETIPGESSRFTAIALGTGRLARGRLAGGHPWDVADRWVVGRERVVAVTGRRGDEGHE
jgi:phage tail-like protein